MVASIACGVATRDFIATRIRTGRCGLVVVVVVVVVTEVVTF
jgi:hypothetical protein